MAATSSAFALVTHGGGTHTCAAAVLGLLLRELSPSTPAIAVVFNATLPCGIFSPGRPARARRGPIPLGAIPRARPAGVGAASPADRAEGRALGAAVRARPLLGQRPHPAPARARAAASTRCGGCSTTTTHWRRRRMRRSTWRRSASIPGSCCCGQARQPAERWRARTTRRVIAWNLKCRHGWFAADQPFLNFVFQNWTTLGEDAWRVRTSADLPPDACAAATADALAAEADSFHFFHSHAPWRPGCRECTRAGRACAGTSPRPRGADRCAAAAAAAAWWGRVRPAAGGGARGWCEARMAEAAGVGGGASACVSPYLVPSSLSPLARRARRTGSSTVDGGEVRVPPPFRDVCS